MAEEDLQSQDDRTEEPSQERRDEFRERGQIAVSKEITSVAVLAGSVLFLTFYIPMVYENLSRLFVREFQKASAFRVTKENVFDYAFDVWGSVLYLIIPMFAVTLFTASGMTFAQTRVNWSWKRLKPDFAKMCPLKGIVRMVSGQMVVELLKGIGKMAAVSVVAYLILAGEVGKVPRLMNVPIAFTWTYWGEITNQLFWAVSALLLLIGGFDYLYNFITLERKMRMTKKEVKEEHKKREVDPHVKGRLRRMQRDLLSGQMVEATKEATVVITNPTHYAVALKYELGMSAPLVVAKGVDFLALRMRETATEHDITIVENKPLARTLYKIAEVGDEIPESLYKAVSEVIRYVFKLKGIKVNKRTSGSRDDTEEAQP